MNRTVAILVFAGLLWTGLNQFAGVHQSQRYSGAADREIAAAFRDQRSGVQVSGEGVVAKVLSDDRNGSPHQRFILRLATGQTVLVAHNTDLAPRIAHLAVGDTVAFSGQYEWNEKGGVIHWTHADPDGRHAAGWLKHAGETYQ